MGMTRQKKMGLCSSEDPGNDTGVTGPRYRLTYFGITGLAECARAAMVLAGIQFEDVRMTMDEWKAAKEKDPLLADKQMPFLDITTGDKKQRMHQSRAILRYIGTIGKYNGKSLYPTDPLEAFYCDEVIEMVEDIRPLMYASFSMTDKEEQKAAREALVAPEGKMTAQFIKLEARLAKYEFAAGPNPTIADIYAVTILYMFQQPSFMDYWPSDTFAAYPHISGLKDKLMELPPLVEYYKDAEGPTAAFKVSSE